MRPTISRLFTVVAVLSLSAVVHAATENARAFPSPAAADSQCSNLTTGPDGTLYLTWSEPGATPEERALKLATLAPKAGVWSTPRIIVSSPLLMENWADFASLCVGTDGALTAQWFQRAGAEGHGYEGWYSVSRDTGATWRTPARLGHEFVALAALSEGRTLAVWLESTRVRDPHAAPRPKRDPNTPRPARDPAAPYAPGMKLLARLLAPDGTSLGDWTIDPDVCTCCQNTVTSLPGDRVFIGYRGHTSEEIRDNCFSFFDLSTRTFSQPAKLRDDNWKISACPVNGPAADARGEAVGVAWFTAADGATRVRARLSSDAGRTFGEPATIDLGRPLGRVETVLLADRSALVIWMEMGTDDNAAGIYARRLFPDGRLSAPHLLAPSTQARASGFPRAALRPDGHVLITLTRTGQNNQVTLLEFDPTPLTPVARSASLPVYTRSLALAAASVELCIAPLTPTPSHSHP